MQETNDTIAAIATPPGRGGIGIVRVSGPAAKRIATALLGQCPPPRRADYLPFHDGEDAILDEGIAIFFAGPHSFTGEDILELHGHGGAVIMDMLLAAVVHQGARLARPGEFSERAFLNAKLDLAQAEAIADLIDASTTQAARGALRSLRGEFSSHIYNMVEQLTELRIYVESMIDFPEEEIDTLTDGAIATKLATVMEQLAEVQQKARQGSLLREGMTIVIAGQPNVGKSSLLNALAGHESAIVTAIPGTTRDILREHITIDGLPLHVIDTAGLRNAKDVVEQEGIRRAWNEITQADGILLVIDDTLGIQQEEHEIMARLPKGAPITIVHNKIDLSGTAVGECPGEWGHHLYLSAKSGIGLDTLRTHLMRSIGYTATSETGFMARQRHLDALIRAANHLQQGDLLLRQCNSELLAEEMRLAQKALGEITGEISSEDLLGRIFTSFCIGK